MTFKDFVKNNSGIDDGKSLPEEYFVRCSTRSRPTRSR